MFPRYGLFKLLAETPDGVFHMPSPLPTGHRRRGSGLDVGAIPELERAIVFSRQKGRTVYVDSAVTTSGNGDSWGGAYSTLAAAIAAAIAGDMILIAPGHAETLSAAGPTLSKTDVTIVGMGLGARRPAFTFGAAATTITITGAGCQFNNVRFLANFANVAAAFTLGAAKDFRVDSCDFVDNGATLNFLSCFVTGATANAADGLAVTNNYCQSLVTTDGAFISILGNLDRLYAADNYVDKAATNDAGHFLTIAALVIKGAQILRNILNVVGSAGAAVGIFMTGSSTTNTGVVGGNWVWSLDTTTPLLLTSTLNLTLFENYYPDAISTSGAIWPVATGP